jgi:hypothetical protein
MKTFIAFLLLTVSASAAEMFYPLVVSNNLTLPPWATNFFTANSNRLWEVIGITNLSSKLDTTNGTAVSLTGSLTNATANGRLLKFTTDQTPYSVYEPTVTNRFIVDVTTAPWQYNHDASIAYFGDRWFAQWNANTNAYENVAGQVNLQSTSTDFITWTTPVEVFNSNTTSTNPVTMDYTAEKQWQPNLIVVGDELWSLWMRENETGLSYPQGWTPYFSKLSSSTGKWTNVALNLNYEENGMTFYGFPTQNPIQLKSGRVLAPLTWVATNYVSPTPSAWGVPTVFWTQEKRAGVIYTDDGGTTWQIGGVTTYPNNNQVSWEPVVQQSDDGTIRMFVRNLDYLSFDASEYLFTALGFSDGLAFEPLQLMSFDTTSSRLGHLFQANNGFGRQIYFLNDTHDGGFISDRRNASVAFSRSSGADLVPGVNFTDSEEVVSYPQGFLKDNKLYVIYSQGSVPRSMKTAVINPAPDADTYYLLPRSNDAVNPQVAYTAGPPAYFDHSASSTMYSVTNTGSWSSTNVSVGAWIYRTSASGTIVDTRELDLKKGFYLGFIGANPFVSLYQSSAPANFTFSTLALPTNAWAYVGLTIAPTGSGITAYVVDSSGTATTETQALATHDGLNGSVAYIGEAHPGSSLTAMIGRVRHVLVLDGVSASANNHRYWHGLDQAALGVSDWAGTETDPGSPFYDYDAGSADAGTNNEDWLAAWSATGETIRGSAASSTVDGRDAISITGTGSVGVELPAFKRGEQLLFGTKLFLTNKTSGYDQVLATIGSRDGQVIVLSRTNNPTLVELYSASSGRYQTLGSYLTNEWVPLTIQFDGKIVTASWNNGTEAAEPLTVSVPTLYVGQGYLTSRSVNPADGFALDVDSTWNHVGQFSRLDNPDLSPEFKAPAIVSTQPTLTLLDTDAGVTNTVYSAGSSVAIARNGTTTLTFGTATGELDISGSGTRYQSTAVDTTPVFIGTKGNGTLTTITPTTSGQTLAAFYGSGYTATNTEATASAGIVVTSIESFTPSAKGASVGVQVTPAGTTTRTTPWEFGADGNVTHTGNAPVLNATATNGTSGYRINVTGASSTLVRFQTNFTTTHTFTADGNAAFTGSTLTLAGVAVPAGNGYKTLVIPASFFTAANTSPATATTRVNSTNNTTDSVWSFSGSADNYITGSFPMPEKWDGTTLKAKFFWRSATTSTNVVTWNIATTLAGDGDQPDIPLGTTQSVSDAGSTTAYLQKVTAATSTIAPSSPSSRAFIVGDTIRILVGRDGDGDGNTDAALLEAVVLQYRETATEPSAW